MKSAVGMCISHRAFSYISAPFSLMDLIALICFCVFESRDVQPVISVAALLTVAGCFWDDAGSPCVALDRPFQFFTCGCHPCEWFSIRCGSKRHIGRRSGDR